MSETLEPQAAPTTQHPAAKAPAADAEAKTPARRKREGSLPGRQDWSTWPLYQAAAAGFRGYWYPVVFSSKVGERPVRVKLLGEDIFVIRDRGVVRGMANRCPHRGVPLSYGNKQFPGTISCVYHGWTFDLESGELKAAITDGPQSPICGKVTQPTYHVEERLGMVWVFVGDGEEPHPIDEQLPEELVGNAAVIGARIMPREGNWRFACENGYDEGHAKYLHRTALWRLFKAMPVWNTTKIVKRGRWIYRVQQEQFWEADFPGLGKWTGLAWYKTKPPKTTTNIGNTGSHREVNPVIAAQDFPGFASVSM
ncbi:MAG: (2Fe-2S)-binding protein, partial [Mycobacterium sp.]|nr:(2Fe-2S)-binding protein [Mycobacterium sp.]